MAVLTSGLMTIDQIDYTKETIQHSLYGVTLTPANLAAQTTLQANYLTALLAITNLNIYKDLLGNLLRNSPKNPPTSMAAQREWQWMVQINDSVTGQNETFRLGGALPSPNLLANSDHANLAATDILAYKTALEAYARSSAGNAVTLRDMIIVGKNDRSPKFIP